MQVDNLVALLLIAEQDEISAAANPEFRQDIRNVKLHRTLRDIEFGRDFLVR